MQHEPAVILEPEVRAEMAKKWNWQPSSRLCFVTTGATAPFNALIEAVLDPSFITELKHLGYTHLLVQYGSAQDVYRKCLAQARDRAPESMDNIIIDGIDFNPEGLQTQFQHVQRSLGLAISHAGSGSILEALRYDIPLIVVPNTELLDNHQDELAAAMERNHYLIRGDVKNLVPALYKSVQFRKNMSQFPPPTSGKHRETKSFAAIMDETMGFLE